MENCKTSVVKDDNMLLCVFVFFLGFFISICSGREIEMTTNRLYKSKHEQINLAYRKLNTNCGHCGFLHGSTVRITHTIQSKVNNKIRFKLSTPQSHLFYKKCRKKTNRKRFQFHSNVKHLKPQKNFKLLKKQKDKVFYNYKTTMIFSKNNRYIHKTMKKHKLLNTGSYKVSFKKFYHLKGYITGRRQVTMPTYCRQYLNKRLGGRSLKVQMNRYITGRQKHNCTKQQVSNPKSGNNLQVNFKVIRPDFQKQNMFSKRYKPKQITIPFIAHNRKRLKTFAMSNDFLNISKNDGNEKPLSLDLYKQTNVDNTIFYHDLSNAGHLPDTENNKHKTTKFVIFHKTINNNYSYFKYSHKSTEPNNDNEEHLNVTKKWEKSKAILPYYSTEYNQNTDNNDSERDCQKININNKKTFAMGSQMVEKVGMNYENKYDTGNEYTQQQYIYSKEKQNDNFIINKDTEIFNNKKRPINIEEKFSRINEINPMTENDIMTNGYEDDNMNFLTTHKSLISKVLNFFKKKLSSKTHTTSVPMKVNYLKTENWDCSEQKHSEESHYCHISDEITTRKSLIRKFLDIIHKETMPREDEGSGGRVGDIFEELIHRGSRAIRKAIQQNMQQDSIPRDNGVITSNRHKESHEHSKYGNSHETYVTFRHRKPNKLSYSTSDYTSSNIDFYDDSSYKVSSIEMNKHHKSIDQPAYTNNYNSVTLTDENIQDDNKQNGYHYYSNSNYNENNQMEGNKEFEINEFHLPVGSTFKIQSEGINLDTDWKKNLSGDEQNPNKVKQKQWNVIPYKEEDNKSNLANNISLSELNSGLQKETKGDKRIYKIQSRELVLSRTNINKCISEILLMKKLFYYVTLITNGSSNILDTCINNAMTLGNNISYALQSFANKETGGYDKTINSTKNRNLYIAEHIINNSSYINSITHTHFMRHTDKLKISSKKESAEVYTCTSKCEGSTNEMSDNLDNNASTVYSVKGEETTHHVTDKPYKVFTLIV